MKMRKWCLLHQLTTASLRHLDKHDQNQNQNQNQTLVCSQTEQNRRLSDCREKYFRSNKHSPCYNPARRHVDPSAHRRRLHRSIQPESDQSVDSEPWNSSACTNTESPSVWAQRDDLHHTQPVSRLNGAFTGRNTKFSFCFVLSKWLKINKSVFQKQTEKKPSWGWITFLHRWRWLRCWSGVGGASCRERHQPLHFNYITFNITCWCIKSEYSAVSLQNSSLLFLPFVSTVISWMSERPWMQHWDRKTL